MEIAIIKYNGGNTGSVYNALERLGYSAVITGDPDMIRRADKVIFPGVGEASSTMKYLTETGLDRLIPELQQPVLGICLGMQLMCSWSEEGNTRGLNIFQTAVRQFKGPVKVPHMGWNAIHLESSPLFNHVETLSYVYFVHSYYAEYGEDTIAGCEYGISFSAALQRKNFYAVQFHPEKSGTVGNEILKNFIAL